MSRSKALHQDLIDTYGGMIKQIELRLDDNLSVQDCLAKSMLKSKNNEDMGHLDMTMLASAFMIGGVETVGPSCTYSALSSISNTTGLY